MQIGKQIREKRLELNMTQDELARNLNVTRSTVSNWENGRNYPDIKLIISTSQILNIPIESLLREDSEVVEKISNDTKEKKKLVAKVKFLYIVVIILIIAVAFFLLKSGHEISNPNAIKSATLTGNTITITTNIPKYRSLESYYLDDSSSDASTIQIILIDKFDIRFKNRNMISIEIPNNQSQATKINFVARNKVFKSLELY